MKPFIKVLLLLLLPRAGLGQDTTITLSPEMVDQKYNVIPLSNIPEWYFRKGNDINWSKKNMDVSAWQKIKPSELSEKLADKNGKLECWLRIKIKLDTSFGNTAFDLFISAWAATDVYVDETLMHSFGNTGTNGKPFKEYNPTYKPPVAFNIEKGKEHLLAIHFVDFTSPLPPYHLKSEGWINRFLAITLPEFRAKHLNLGLIAAFYRTIWLWANIILCLLFWLLAFQNRAERNILLIALTSTCITLTVYSDQYIMMPGLSFAVYKLLGLAWSILSSLVIVLAMLLLLRIFKRSITPVLKFLFLIILISGVSEIFFQNILIQIFKISMAILVYSYYIITSWKTLRGAQWAVLTGILLAISFGLSLAITASIAPERNSLISLLYTGLFLSFPLSLLVYVAMRFKEIIKEVRENAKQVVQLSEEKKEQAINQQKILQEEVNRQTIELRTSLKNLKATQSQLIQSEKMASLGELTAGIAHEIQNPLNFVNNFSDVNKELVDELQLELKAGKVEDAISISNDIKDNEEKINHHGKRADAIVKNMLQHSRSSSGKKEPTDINALVEEYLRLSYHGLRAKDKSFNATMQTNFDPGIGKINIIAQDIGRVVLNLINNAFYAVDEKRKQHPNGYEPSVSVSTRKEKDKVEIKVKDNGNGVPQKILDKIFQPFFTTKPAGEGTGLGLSLSYDIINAHGGEIKVETKEGEGSTFIIQLPISE